MTLVLCLTAVSNVTAQGEELWVRIAPLAGQPGTTVTMTGGGAPSGAEVSILAAPFTAQIDCHAERDAAVIATVTADANGRFSATHHAARQSQDQLGYTYLAKRFTRETPQPQSSLACFRFDDEPARYFPETGQTLRGRFLVYWQQNGGLPVFGYPLTNARKELNSSGDYVTVQYLERQRFERHPTNAAPYDVLLGRLGAELLMARGTPPGSVPRTDPEVGCRYFPETGHNVCNQAFGMGFLSYWQSHGLDFGDPGFSYRESLALFGLPLTEPVEETNSSGDQVLTQWFERARFEWHPSNPDQYKVLLGRLGSELLATRGDMPVVDTVTIYLVGLGGGDVGCGDRIIPVDRTVEPTTAPLTAAIEELLALDERLFGQSGLYNALYQSELNVTSVALSDDGHAIIHLAGQLRIGGVCDAPRVRRQLEETALHFDTVTSVAFFINGIPLAEHLSGR